MPRMRCTPGWVAIVVDIADGATARLAADGIDIDERARGILRLFEQLTAPQTLAAFGRLLDRGLLDAHALDSIGRMSTRLPRLARRRRRRPVRGWRFGRSAMSTCNEPSECSSRLPRFSVARSPCPMQRSNCPRPHRAAERTTSSCPTITRCSSSAEVPGGISVAARLRLAQPALSPIACERGWMTSRCDHDEAQLPVTRRSDHLRSS